MKHGYLEVKPKMSNAVLTLRPDEKIHLFEYPPDGDCYAVMLLETPPLPGKQREGIHNLTVIAGAKYSAVKFELDEPLWAWVTLDSETKDAIGDALVMMNANPGQWYYLLIVGGIGHRPTLLTEVG